MMSPSDEKRIVAMVDSFTKTVARNFSRNLKRAKANAEKHYSDEPIDYYAPWGDVVMFYGSFDANGSLFALGEAVSGAEQVANLTGTVEIDVYE